jgi:hypothetical protein
MWFVVNLLIIKLLLLIFLVCLLNLVIRSLLIGKNLIWKIYSQQTAVSQDGVMWSQRMDIYPK